MFEIKTIKDISKQSLKSIFDNFNTIFETEKQLLNIAYHDFFNKEITLHILYLKDKPIGLIVFNIEIIGELKLFSIEFLFVDNLYRKTIYKELDDNKISKYLLFFALKEVCKINETINIDMLIITPTNEKIKSLYIDFGFEYLDDDFLYINMLDIQC
jgi:hypothetical protein